MYYVLRTSALPSEPVCATGTATMLALSLLACTSAIPTVKLNNGVEMPMISLGTWQYKPDVAESTVKLGLSLGFNHIDTANDYKNQAGVGAALAGRNRSSYFLTTKVPAQTIVSAGSAYAATTKNLNDDLSELRLSFVDLVRCQPQPGDPCCCD